MSNGIAHNNLNDISKIYLDTISDINKKEQEDDVKRWQQEEAGCDTTSKSPFRKKKVKAYKEAFSNWRKDLREVTSDAEAVEVDDQPEIKEKKVKNKIKINPEFKEAVKQIGGELLEVKEVDKDEKKKEQDDAKAKKVADKEKKLKLRILRVKMMAAKQDAGSSIVAGYEPDIDGAVEYFYEEGINEEGIEQLVEEIGLDEFVNFIEGGTVELNEERAARRASVRAKKYDVVKKEVDKADAARRKSKKGEYSAAYKKKETDVTVYDDKPAAKKKATPVKKATPAKKAAPAKKPAAPKKPVTKKVVKAVAKVKKTQPAKKASKPGLRDKISTFYKRGVERHKKAREAGRVPEKRAKEFASGVKSGVKTAVKFAKDVKKVVSKEELEMQEKVLDKFETSEKERIVKGMKKSSKDLKKRYGKEWKSVMYATATKRAKEAGDTSKSDKRYAVEGSAYGLWKGDGKRKLPGDKKKKEDVKEATRYKKEKGYDKGGTKKPSGEKDPALSAVVSMIRKKHGKSAIIGQGSRQQKKVKGAKSSTVGKYKKAADEKKQLKKDAKEMGYGSDTKGYIETRARYGSKENMKSGKGLGT